MIRPILVFASSLIAAGCVDVEAYRRDRSARQLQIDLTRPTCTTPAVCERMWALANQWVSEWADMKIQVATDYLVETYNPTSGKLGARVEKRPDGPVGYTFFATATCNGTCRIDDLAAVQAFNSALNELDPGGAQEAATAP